MDSHPEPLSRDELYRQVWSEPMVRVAQRLGLSDRGLAKICERHRIPVPPRGWWARKRSGQAVRRTPLPKGDGVADEVVILPDPDGAKPSSATAQPNREEIPELVREKSPEWRIVVPDDLALTHPLVRAAQTGIRQTARQARAQRADPWAVRPGRSGPGPGCIDIAVSKSLIPRALRIMQALMAALESRGYVVTVQDDGKTFVDVLGERFGLGLKERFKQVKVKTSYGERTELEPSGRLALLIDPTYYSTAGVTDEPNRPIEGRLNKFVASLVRRSVRAKRERAILLDREQRWRVHDEQRRRQQQTRNTEQLRYRRFQMMAVRWGRHERQLQFLATLERRIAEGHLPEEGRDEATRRIEWTRAQLQERDPVDVYLMDPWPTAPLPPEAGMPWDWR
jgi:hypothetical protein